MPVQSLPVDNSLLPYFIQYQAMTRKAIKSYH